jgi:hypothetical protein
MTHTGATLEYQPQMDWELLIGWRSSEDQMESFRKSEVVRLKINTWGWLRVSLITYIALGCSSEQICSRRGVAPRSSATPVLQPDTSVHWRIDIALDLMGNIMLIICDHRFEFIVRLPWKNTLSSLHASIDTEWSLWLIEHCAQEWLSWHCLRVIYKQSPQDC